MCVGSRSLAHVEAALHKDFGECVCPGAGDEGLGRVEGHVVYALVRLLPMGRDLLHARLAVQVPQTH